MERTHHSLITDGVLEQEQTLHVSKPFWVFFAGNIGLPTWLMGVLVAGMGINFAEAMFILILGNAIGAILPATIAILGPRSKLSSIELSRFALGTFGKRIPAALQWIACVSWDSVNNLLAASALVLFCSNLGLPAPLWLILAVMIGIQMLIGIYGHHAVQETSKYTGILLGVAFVAIGLIAMHQTSAVTSEAKPSQLKDLLSAFLLVVTFNQANWTAWTADYTRYLPKKTPFKHIFLVVFSPIFLSSVVLMFFGYVTSSAVAEQTPEGVMRALQGLSGHFAPLVLLLIGVSSTPVNAVNDNSASYSLISTGVKVSRPAAAIFGAALGYGLCLLASSTFIELFENLLSFFAHWIVPWVAIVLVHWFVVGRKGQKTPTGISLGGWLFIVTTALSVILFSANSLYRGPLSSYCGGLDIGPYFGFTFAAVVYYLVLSRSSVNT